MEFYLLVAIIGEIGVSITALSFWFAPISWRYHKKYLIIPSEVRQLFDLPRLEVLGSNFSVVADHPLKVPEFKTQSQEAIYGCVTCGLVFNDREELDSHYSTTLHGKPKDSPTFAVKVGSPYDTEDNTPGPGLYRVVLKSGERLP